MGFFSFVFIKVFVTDDVRRAAFLTFSVGAINKTLLSLILQRTVLERNKSRTAEGCPPPAPRCTCELQPPLPGGSCYSGWTWSHSWVTPAWVSHSPLGPTVTSGQLILE